MDLSGPTTYTSIGGNKYNFLIMDDFTRYTWIAFLIDKSDVFATFKTLIKRVQNEFKTIIKKVRSDNESEFKIQELMSFVMSMALGINSWLSIHHNPMG
jgi:hypothetical protein